MTTIIPRRAILGAALLASTLGYAGPAFAAPASAAKTLHVSRSVTIDAPAAKVWGIVHNFGNLTWVPAVKSSQATDCNKPGSVRTLNLGGPKLTEQLVHYDAPETMYKYEIQNTPENLKVLPVSHYRSVISVQSLGPNKSKAMWTGSFKRADPSANPAKGMDDESALTAIRGIYSSGLDNLKKFATGAG